jgi:iron complex outermembrane receptor protein
MRRNAFLSLRACAPACVLVASGVMFLEGPALAASNLDVPDQSPTALGSLAGTVAVAETGHPVADALVRVLGTNLQATTLNSGHFTLPNVPPGVYGVSAIAPGYLETSLNEVRVTAGSATSIKIELRPTLNFMERVQVTATAEPLSIGEVPGQANVIDQLQIEQRGALSILEAVNNVPGLLVARVESSIGDVMLRGVSSNGFPFSTTLLLIDGVPQADSRNSASTFTVAVEDAASIEVVRGPNAAIYGRTAVGGSLNILTADPTLEHRFAVDAQVGELNYLKGAARASGPIHDWGGYYVSWTSTKDDGYTKQTYDLRNKANELFAKFTFTPDSKSHGKLTFNSSMADQGEATSAPIVNGHFLTQLDPRFGFNTNLQLPTANFHQEDVRGTLNYTRSFADWLEFVEVFGYHTTQYKWTDASTIVGPPYDLSTQMLTMYPYEETLNEKNTYEEGHFIIKPRLGGIENSLLVGASYFYTSGSNLGHLIYTDPDTVGWPLNYLTPVFPDRGTWQYVIFGGNRYTLGNTGVYGEYVISPTRRLQLIAAGRYDRLDLSNIKFVRPDHPTIQNTFDKFSPKLSATLKLLGTAAGAGALNLYGVYSKAFLPPRRPTDLNAGNVSLQLQPVDVRNYEIGLKGNLLSGKVSLEGTFFKMTEDGVIVTLKNGPFFSPSNGGTEDFRGVEVGVTWTPIRELSFYANGAFYHNRFGHFVIQSADGDTVLTGNRLPIAPDRVYSAGANFQHQSWGATLNLKHVGDVFLDQGNTFVLDPYTLVDASLSWSHDALRLTLSGHNLFNKVYYSWGDTSTATSAELSPPRQVVLKASVTFK